MPREPELQRQAGFYSGLGFGFVEEAPASGPAAQPAREDAPRPPARPAVAAAAPFVPPASDSLAGIAAEVAACRACRLCDSRTRTVPGQGNPRAELMFVGEGPGESEDQQGLAFVGAAGQLLTKIISAMKFDREGDVFIANVVKCRPPGNRVPEPDEMAACLPYLKRQIALVRPRVIVALGATAIRGLLPRVSATPISKLRGAWLELDGTPLMPTFHPAYLLRSPEKKHDVWADMKVVMERLGRKAE